MNYKAVDAGIEHVRKVDVPASWKDAQDVEQGVKKDIPAFIEDVVNVINRQEGNKLPVSAFADRADGTFPQGTSKYENAALPLMFRSGRLTSVFSVTSVRMSVRTLLFVRSY